MAQIDTNGNPAAKEDVSLTINENYGNILNNNNNSKTLGSTASSIEDESDTSGVLDSVLAEFLSAVMQKDYQKALKFCELILEFEPNNSTAKDFYPLIQEKLTAEENGQSSDEDIGFEGDADDDDFADISISNEEDGDNVFDNLKYLISSDDSTTDSSADLIEEKGSNDLKNRFKNRSDSTTHSYSSLILEDEEEDIGEMLKKIFQEDVENGNDSVHHSPTDSPSEPSMLHDKD